MMERSAKLAFSWVAFVAIAVVNFGCESKVRVNQTDVYKAPTEKAKDGAATTLPTGDLPAQINDLIPGASPPSDANGKVQIKSEEIIGSYLVIGAKTQDERAVATSIVVTEIDGSGHRACFNANLTAFSICPAPPIVVSVDSSGLWSYSISKALLLQDANYHIDLEISDKDSKILSAASYDFQWLIDPKITPSQSPSPNGNSAPFILSVTSVNTNTSYKAGDLVDIAVTFSEPVVVTGHPKIEIQTGQSNSAATYTIGSGSRVLTFVYTVGSGDIAGDLDYASDHALILGTGDSIKTADGSDTAASLALPSPGNEHSLGGGASIAIDGLAPQVTGVTSFTGHSPSTIFKAGDVIDLAVRFSESVTVTGTPQLSLSTGAVASFYDGVAAPDASTLIFRYTVSTGQLTTSLDFSGTSALSFGGGTITDLVGNLAQLTLPPPGSAGSLSASGVILVDSTDPVVSQITSTATNTTYISNQVIDLQIQFSEAVSVTGAPQLTLETGSVDRGAMYTNGSGTNILNFSYTVQPGDSSTDLDYVSTAALILNGGFIRDLAGNNASLVLAQPGTTGSLGAGKAIVIDAVAPLVNSVQSSAGTGPHKAGDVILVTATFSKSVNVTGTPQLTLETGTIDAVALYTSGSPGSTLTFRYDVVGGNNSPDLDYQSTSALSTNGGSIADSSGNNANLTLPSPGAVGSLGSNSSLVIDTSPPVVSQVTSANTNGTKTVGQSLSLQVVFSEAVTVVGIPQLALETGATDYLANYSGGSGTNTIAFAYTVQAGDVSSDLDYVSTAALGLNSGTIKDSAGNNATLTLAAPGAAGSLGSSKSFMIDTISPAITAVNSPTSNGTYKAGEVVQITLSFSSSVTVVGAPQLTLETGSTDGIASYASGSPGTNLTFQYSVGAGENSVDLDYVNASALSLNGGTIRDTATTNNAILALPAPGAAGSLAANKNIVIDTTAPTVSQVTASNTNGSFTLSQTVTVQIVFSEVVVVTGTPQITLETGATDAVVSYSSGSPSTTLSFVYTVQANDFTSDLDYISTSALALNGGTIKDSVGNNATLTLATPGQTGSLGSSKDILIDANPVSTFTIVGPTLTNTTTPTLTWNAATGATKYDVVVSSTANCGTVSYSSANVVTNSKTITALGAGTYYLCVTAKDNGTNTRLASNNALTMVIDNTGPTVSSVTSNTPDGSYTAGAVIDILVTFTESVTVTGTPTLQLETGATDQTLNYVSGSGSPTLLFNYTVQASNVSADLNYKATNSLVLAGGTIKDAATNNATLTLPALASASALAGSKAIVVDAIAPAVSGVSSSKTNGTYGVGIVIDVLVTFSETVFVTGIPTIQLATGTTNETVNYASGSGSTVLTFNYTVQSDNYTTDLTYVATTSLVAASSTIKDSAGNDATLTLAAPTAAGSLGNNKNIQVNAIVTPPGGSFSISAVQPYGSNGLLVTWGTPTGQGISYTLKYGIGSGSYPNTVSASAVSPATITNLSNGSLYYIMVTATNTAGSLNASSEQSGTPVSFWVSAGPDRTEKASATLNGLSQGASSLAWTKTSGPGTITYGTPTTATTTVSADADGTYVLRLTGTDAGAQQQYDEMTLVWDTVSPSFTSIGLTSIASDGTLDRFEARAPTNLVTNLVASNYQTAKYFMTDNAATCSTYGDFYYHAEVPVGFETYLYPANDYKICVKLSRRNGNSVFGETAAFTRELVLPAADTHTVKSVAIGQSAACAILENNTLRCWGQNGFGELGYDDAISRGDTVGEFAALPSVNLGASRTAKKVVIGDNHTCAILDDDTLKCWGQANYIGIGDGNHRGNNAGEMALLPLVPLGSGRLAKDIAVGPSHSCVILDDDTLKCWGEATSGALGYDDLTNRYTQALMATLPTVFLGTNRTAKAVAVGGYHSTCAILDTDEVKCWGANIDGSLGLGDTSSRGNGAASMNTLPAVNLGASRTAKAISMGSLFTCVILDTDALKCWGSSDGQLGNESGDVGTTPASMAALADVNLGAGRTAKAVNTGYRHTCAILDNDNLKCWGRNTEGQLGNEDRADRGLVVGDMAALVAVNLGTGRSAKAISSNSNSNSNCVILDTNAVKCWGENSAGMMGNDSAVVYGGTTSSVKATTGVNVGASRTFKKVSLGTSHSCAILDTDEVKCWGYGLDGILGYGDTITRGGQAGEMAALPVLDFGGGRKVKDIATSMSHSCAILDDDNLKCWGNNGLGGLGLGDSSNRGDNAGELAAMPVVNLGSGRTAKKVQTGQGSTCVILDTDQVKCWGTGVYGQLGTNSNSSLGSTALQMTNLAPVFLGTNRTALAMSHSNYHVCVILDDQTIKCWGYNVTGQLGYNDALSRGDGAGEMEALPIVNIGQRRAKKIAAGLFHTCAVLDDDTVKCWGHGTVGQLGINDFSDIGDSAGEMASLPTVNLGAGRTAIDIRAKGDASCAILDDASVKCWGQGRYGVTGYDDKSLRGYYGGTMATLNPINFGPGRTASNIELNQTAACAILDDLSLHCWGVNDSGNLGYDDRLSRGGGIPLKDAPELYFP